VPALIVEVKRADVPGDLEAAVAQLAAYQNLVGATRALVFDGEWHEPDAFGGQLTAVPTPTVESSIGVVPPSSESLERAVRAELWRAFDEVRGQSRAGVELLAAALERALASGEWPSSIVAQLLESEQGRQVVEAAVREELDRLDRAGSESTTTSELNLCLRNLLLATDGIVFDPFCGAGSTLRAIAEASGSVALTGSDVNSGAVHLARILNRLSGVEMQLRVADSLRSPQPSAEFIVSDPPLGLRLQLPVTLSDGTTTKDGDCAVLDACLRSLVPLGRAVIVTAPGILSRGGDAQRLRQSIAASFRLVAVIRLPSGVLGTTSIAPALLVVERREPSDTLFAVLEEDWLEQLQPGGEFYEMYLSRIDRTRR
jgi:hypothetical protein